MTWLNTLTSCVDWTAVKDVVVALAAAVTATVAVLGLSKWRQELRGKAHFETARALARATYRLRNELQSARSPMIWASEFPDHPQTTPEEKAQAYGHVFQNRWKPVLDSVLALDGATLEAEALWGAEIAEKVTALRKCAAKLKSGFDAFIRNEQSGGRDFAADSGFGKNMHDRVWGTPDDDENELSKEIRTTVADIESFLRPHLRK